MMPKRSGRLKANSLRILAICCILASLPLAFLKYMALPATIMEFVDLQRRPVSWATTSYRVWRTQRIAHLELAFLLYALGTVSLVALYVIVAAPKLLPWWGELSAWGVTVVTGLAVAEFERPIMPGTDRAYVFMAVYMPTAIAVMAAVAFVVALGSQFQRKRSIFPS